MYKMEMKVFTVVMLSVSLACSSPTPPTPPPLELTMTPETTSGNIKGSEKDFSLHITEKGNRVEEKVHIDPEKKIEVFHVPAHNDLEEIYSVFDFQKNLTLRVFPAKQLCHVSHLRDDDIPNPDQLIKGLEEQSKIKTTQQVKRTSMQDWVITGSPVLDRSFLGETMMSYCPNFTLTRIQPMPELATIEETGKDETKPVFTKSRGFRRKRWSSTGATGSSTSPTFEYLSFDAPGGLVLSTCPPYMTAAKCRIVTSACTYVISCDYDFISQKVICNESHQYSRSFCCKPCCNSESKSDMVFPFCDSMADSDITC